MERCTHTAGWCLDINALKQQQRRGVLLSLCRPAAGEISAYSHLSVSHTLSCFLFTVQSGDFFFSPPASPLVAKKIYLLHVTFVLFIYLFIYPCERVAETAIFWQMWLTGSWLCVSSGYVTAAVI